MSKELKEGKTMMFCQINNINKEIETILPNSEFEKYNNWK